MRFKGSTRLCKAFYKPYSVNLYGMSDGTLKAVILRYMTEVKNYE